MQMACHRLQLPFTPSLYLQQLAAEQGNGVGCLRMPLRRCLQLRAQEVALRCPDLPLHNTWDPGVKWVVHSGPSQALAQGTCGQASLPTRSLLQVRVQHLLSQACTSDHSAAACVSSTVGHSCACSVQHKSSVPLMLLSIHDCAGLSFHHASPDSKDSRQT